MQLLTNLVAFYGVHVKAWIIQQQGVLQFSFQKHSQVYLSSQHNLSQLQLWLFMVKPHQPCSNYFYTLIWNVFFFLGKLNFMSHAHACFSNPLFSKYTQYAFFFIILSMLLFPSDSDEQGISQVRQTPEDHTFSLHQTPTASADVFTIIELHHSCFSVPY